MQIYIWKFGKLCQTFSRNFTLCDPWSRVKARLPQEIPKEGKS